MNLSNLVKIRLIAESRVKNNDVHSDVLPKLIRKNWIQKNFVLTKDIREMRSIMMKVLSNSATISEICRKYNVASSPVYKRVGEFISAGTAAMEHGRSTLEASITREINELKDIIGELTIANEPLKKL